MHNVNVPDEVIEWVNDHPDIAIGLFPEVERYLKWKNSPFIEHVISGQRVYDRNPRTFTTRKGIEVK